MGADGAVGHRFLTRPFFVAAIVLSIAATAFAANTDVVVLRNGDAGGSYTKSSGVGQMTIDVDADYRRPAYDLFTNFVSNLTRSRSETITQFTLRSGYMKFRDDGWIFSPFAYVARNVDLGLSLGHDYPKRSVDLSLLTFPETNRWGRVRANANVR